MPICSTIQHLLIIFIDHSVPTSILWPPYAGASLLTIKGTFDILSMPPATITSWQIKIKYYFQQTEIHSCIYIDYTYHENHVQFNINFNTKILFVVRSLVASPYPINLSRLYLYKLLQVNHSITK